MSGALTGQVILESLALALGQGARQGSTEHVECPSSAVAVGIGLDNPVALAVVGVLGALAQGVDDCHEMATLVVLELRGAAGRVGLGDLLAQGVVGHRGLGAVGQKGPDQATGLVVDVLGSMTSCIGHGRALATAVVLVGGLVAERINDLGVAASRVVLVEGAVTALVDFLDPSSGRVINREPARVVAVNMP